MGDVLREEELFDEARRVTDAAQRVRFLDEHCGDAAMRLRVEQLLAALNDSDDYFRPLASPVPPQFADSLDVGTSIGRYKLLEKIGEGGFGVVYVAEQSEPMKRRVALKIIKLGMDTKQVVARFEAERQALALMDHPNIAKVHDGGATETGRPYFVMELVRGVPITKYCEENELSVRERLKLFERICHAVQHAHQKGIIHRDLKPSNILVTVNDGVPVPKVIDFGVVKATQQELTEKTIFTQFHHFIGTPAYMSPEQAEMTSVDIDTRSDIYSLGVLLYELLTGKTPFDGKDLLASGLDEMRRTIREEQPLRPSARLQRECSSARSAPRPAQSTIDFDVDWIVMKCLEKDRSRRYETASALAADVDAHLDNRTVSARPPSTRYRLGKWVRRHRLIMAASSAMVAALLAGIVLSSWQALRATRAERLQAHERERAEQRLSAAVKFMDKTLNVVAPQLGDLTGAARPRQNLAEAAAAVIEDLKQGDEPGAEFRRVLAHMHLQLAFAHGWFAGNTTGEFDKALVSALEAIRLFESPTNVAPTDEQLGGLMRSQMAAGFAAWGLVRDEEALAHFREMQRWAEALVTRRSAQPGWQGYDWRHAARSCIAWIRFEMGHTEVLETDQLPLLNEVIAKGANSKNLQERSEIAAAHQDVGYAYRRLGKDREALPHFREAHRISREVHARDPRSAQFATMHVVVQADLGETLLALENPDEGLPLLTNAVSEARELYSLDTSNAGFAKARIDVLRLSALGHASWAVQADSPAEGQRRLAEAQAFLDKAEELLARLKSESLRNFIRKRHLDGAIAKLREAQAKVADRHGR